MYTIVIFSLLVLSVILFHFQYIVTRFDSLSDPVFMKFCNIIAQMDLQTCQTWFATISSSLSRCKRLIKPQDTNQKSALPVNKAQDITHHYIGHVGIQSSQKTGTNRKRADNSNSGKVAAQHKHDRSNIKHQSSNNTHAKSNAVHTRQHQGKVSCKFSRPSCPHASATPYQTFNTYKNISVIVSKK